MDQIKIALVGKAATGKTFIALYLYQKYGFKRMKLAGGVRTLMRIMYGLHKNAYPHWQTQIQLYDAMYKIDPNIHLSSLSFRMEQTTSNVVTEDVRYIHEVQRLVEMGYIIVRVTTPETVRKTRIVGVKKAAAGTVTLSEYFNTDETRSYKAQYTIVNTDRDTTRKSVDSLMEILGVPKKGS